MPQHISLPIHGGAPGAASAGLAHDSQGVPYLALDGSTDETRIFSFRVPDDYASGLAVTYSISMASATTGNVAIRNQLRAISDGVTIKDAALNALEASADVSVPGTAGHRKTITHNLSNLSGVVPGASLALETGRENATSGSNATGDMHVWDISLTYTAS